MKKTIRLWVIALMITLLGITSIAEARKGQTSSDPEQTSSSSSYSKSSKSSRRSKSNSFGDAAKTKQAKTAWQDYLKKNTESEPVSLEKDSSNLEQQYADLKAKAKSEKKRKKADKLAKQLAGIEKQIADAKRQQQLIAVAQTAAQALLNRQRQPAVARNSSYNDQSSIPTSSVNQATASTAKPEQTNKSGGGWGMIFLIAGAVVIVLLWRSKRNNTTTIYRL